MLTSLVLVLAGLAIGSLIVAFVAATRRTQPSPQSKAWWRSKTLWVNLAVVLGSGFTIVEASTGELRQHLSPIGYLLLLVVLGMVNTGLRLVTTKGLSGNSNDV